MSYSDEVEPLPGLPAKLPTRPIWIVWAVCSAAAIGLSVIWPWWSLLFFAPTVAYSIMFTIITICRYRRYDRELDGWSARMNAWYDARVQDD